jgi:hypothetical protein
MDNPYMNYYVEQAGSGYAVYSGTRYQNGNGFFGKILKQLKPAIKYLGRQGLKTVSSIGRDLLNGENFVESAKSNLLNTGRNIMSDAIDKAEKYAEQTGNGLKRKRVYKRRSTLVKKKIVKKRSKTRKTIKRKSINKTNKKKKIIGFF